jgi:iron complex outermembrane receptor protein
MTEAEPLPSLAPLKLRRCVLTALATLGACGITLDVAAQQDAPSVELPRVESIVTTPLPGLGTPLRDVPANVQTYGGRELGRQRQGNVTEFLEQNPTSVNVNAAQGNPYQLDVSFRGFTASPLVGVPQGLSVFQDGVRINEPFGDVVNWDLLPQSAIADITLIPGSNPLFGLNTLGGALAVTTKDGRRHPGGAAELSGGSFGRNTLQLEQGGASGSLDYFVTANVSRERGWAEHNPSRIGQLFGKLGYRQGGTNADLSLTAADNRLEGTQTLPLSFFGDVRQAYTHPDVNTNRIVMLAVEGQHELRDGLLLGGNAYLRRYRNGNVSSNVNDEFGEIDPLTGLVDTVQAHNDKSLIDQTSAGLGLQLSLKQQLAGMTHQFVLGASSDFGRARYTQDTQPADLTPSRGAVGTDPFENRTLASTRNRNLSVFAMDSVKLTPLWTLTASGRFNAASVSIRDDSGSAPELNGDHAFRRFNPALGLNFNPSSKLTAYGSYNEGMRAPTAMELTCADPATPCKLPNAFLADPPLKKVVAHTLEMGARGRIDSFSWSAAAYRTGLSDDIQFVGGQGALNAGYFQNVGRTRRQGVELNAGRRWGALGIVARYSFIDATYRAGFIANSPSNSTADANGDIVINGGDRIPGIPRHSLHLRLDLDVDEATSLGANLVANSASRARGDENNRDANGSVPGYTVLNLDGRYRFGNTFEAFARINNVFDRRYANFAILGRNAFTGPGRSFDPANAVDEPFRGLGAPRGVWIGLRSEWE